MGEILCKTRQMAMDPMGSKTSYSIEKNLHKILFSVQAVR